VQRCWLDSMMPGSRGTGTLLLRRYEPVICNVQGFRVHSRRIAIPGCPHGHNIQHFANFRIITIGYGCSAILRTVAARMWGFKVHTQEIHRDRESFKRLEMSEFDHKQTIKIKSD